MPVANVFLRQHGYFGSSTRGKNAGRTRIRMDRSISTNLDASAQYNFTDRESRIMKAGNGKHFEQCYNAQAAVEVESMIIVGAYASDNANDKREMIPNREQAKANGFEVERVLADTGYYSDEAVRAAEKEGIDALVAVEKGRHGHSLENPRRESR